MNRDFPFSTFHVDYSAFSPLRMASAASNSPRAVSRSSNSNAEVANLLCFFAALICLNGKDTGRALPFTGLITREDWVGVPERLCGGVPRGEWRSPNAELVGVGKPFEPPPNRGTNGLIRCMLPLPLTMTGPGTADEDETRR